MSIYKNLNESVEFILQYTNIQPKLGLVLGSGLGSVADVITEPVRIPYTEIPHFVKSTVEGHKGELVIGKFQNKNIVIMQGRLHFYEGYSMQEITYPIRVITLLGVKTLILTSAVGAINKDFNPGDIVFVVDHINLMGDNPLRGMNYEPELGERFPDMTEIYDKNLIALVEEIAKKQNITAHRGVYIACRGPSYETPAEIKMFEKLGADVVGMSVVPEAIVAHQMGLKLLCIAYVSNKAAGISKTPLSHKEVIETAKSVCGKLSSLLSEFICIYQNGG